MLTSDFLLASGVLPVFHFSVDSYTANEIIKSESCNDPYQFLSFRSKADGTIFNIITPNIPPPKTK